MSNFKLLYLSCHSVLERDEISLFHELGIKVFSPGAFVEPQNPGDASLRPGIPDLVYDPEDLAAFHRLGKPGMDNKDVLTKEFVDRFDAVLVMHLPRWVVNNWEAMKHKPVIWRTIGQSIAPQEELLSTYRKKGMKIVRYSPMERSIPGYIGEDRMIRFYKDPTEFGSWNGHNKEVITFAQSMKKRNQACNFSFFESTTRLFPRKLFGPGNEDTGDMNQGKKTFPELQQALRDHRVYFSTGTHPASYTLNFMEAWMTGTPIVAIGPERGNPTYFPGHKLYEVDKLIEHGVSGFVSDNSFQLRKYIQELMDDDSLAARISTEGRRKAIEIFGKRVIAPQWKEFLDSL